MLPILRQFFPVLMLFLALFYTVPRINCVCAQTAAVAAPARQEHRCCRAAAVAEPVGKEHSCCLVASAVQSVWSQAQMAATKACCGMMSTASPAVASSIQLIGSFDLDQIKVFSPFIGSEVKTLVHQGLLANMNRPPPRIRGFGTSETYLFKRTLLI